MGRYLQTLRGPYVTLGSRLILGTTFVVSGAGKLPEQAAFVNTCTEYGLLPDALARVYGTALPFVEIAVGSLLLIGLLTRFAAGLGILTALSCIVANCVVLYRGLNMECGCFGEVAVLQTRDALIIDFVLLLMGTQILLHKKNFLGMDMLKGKLARSKASG